MKHWRRTIHIYHEGKKEIKHIKEQYMQESESFAQVIKRIIMRLFWLKTLWLKTFFKLLFLTVATGLGHRLSGHYVVATGRRFSKTID